MHSELLRSMSDPDELAGSRVFPVPSAETLLELGLSWNGIPLDIWLEPWRITPAVHEQIRSSTRAFCRAIMAATELFLEQPALRRRFDYTALQERLVLTDPGYQPSIPLGRLDLYLTETGPKLLEFNTDGAAGWYWVSAIESLSRRSAGLTVQAQPLSRKLLDTLVSCYRQWERREREVPRISIVDWREVSTRSEQVALCREFQAWGFPCSLEDPRDLVLRDGRLQGPHGLIDLVYRRLVSEEAMARSTEIPAFLQGYLDRAACYVGGFRTDPAWSKTIFSVLTDPAFQAQLPQGDREWLQRCVPWTVAVTNGEVSHGLSSKALQGRLLAYPHEYIIKPAKGYAGKGVCAGAVVDSVAWNAAVQQVFEHGNWVVQEYCQPPALPGPQRDGFRYLHGMAFVLGGDEVAIAGRTSRTPILGSTTPEVWFPMESRSAADSAVAVSLQQSA